MKSNNKKKRMTIKERVKYQRQKSLDFYLKLRDKTPSRKCSCERTTCWSCFCERGISDAINKLQKSSEEK